MKLERYLATRRHWEIGLWGVILTISFLANVGVSWFDIWRNNLPVHFWEPIVWNATSNVVAGGLIPLILIFDGWFPIRLNTWRRNLAAHAIGTVFYSLLHVAFMYWGRVYLYKLIGNNSGYLWPNWWLEFGYEYLKDFRSYIAIVATIYLYRFILIRLQGEAAFLSEDHEKAKRDVTADHLLIKKLDREFLVRIDRIDWIESAGNYVNIRVGEQVYPLRETMAGISEYLSSRGFCRTHRSAIVNLDRVTEITTSHSGDGEVRLASGVGIPISRRYRKQLKERLRLRN